MEFSYNFEVNNIRLCIKIEVNYHMFKTVICYASSVGSHLQ